MNRCLVASSGLGQKGRGNGWILSLLLDMSLLHQCPAQCPQPVILTAAACTCPQVLPPSVLMHNHNSKILLLCFSQRKSWFFSRGESCFLTLHFWDRICPHTPHSAWLPVFAFSSGLSGFWAHVLAPAGAVSCESCLCPWKGEPGAKRILVD